MSDNEDLLADDLGDHSLADYNIDNEEEEQLLADDFERGESQNVPTSVGPSYAEVEETPSYSNQRVEYQIQPPLQQYIPKADCVVPNILVEVPNPKPAPISKPLPTYAPYSEEHAVPPPRPAVTVESPQIVPSEVPPTFSNGDSRERFTSERPFGAQRLPQIRDIPDSLDKVVVPRGSRGRGASSWRNPMLRGRPHPYTHYPQRGHFMQRPQFPPPRPAPPQPRPDIQPEPMRQLDQDRPMMNQDRPMMPKDRPMMNQDRPMMNQDRPMMNQDRPMMNQDRPMMPQDRHMVPQDRPMMPQDRPMMPQDRPMQRGFNPNFQRFPNLRPSDPRPNFRPSDPRPNFRPNFDRPQFFRPFGPPIREVIPGHMPQVTIRQPMSVNNDMKGSREPEVRMLPVQLPPNLPGGLQGKKVLINPHFKGNFQPPEGLPLLPTYIPTRIQKTPPRTLSPTLESKFGPIKDIDDAAERFIAEQRNALARAAGRQSRRSPQRYIENTTIEIANDLARPPDSDNDLLRRQEEFINANRAGLRRRMRSPPAPPRRSPERRRARTRSRSPEAHANDEDSEYRRRVREQESLRERVLRAKEVRRRKNAVALLTREREQQDKNKEKDQQPQKEREHFKSPPQPKVEEKRPLLETPRSPELVKPDTTRKSPEKEVLKKLEKTEKERSPVKKESEVNSTCDSLTPPRPGSGALTPPLPAPADDDELELILDDIDDILSDDDDRVEAKVTKPKVTQIDLRAKLPPKPSNNESKRERQKIVFAEERDKKRDKSPTKAKSPSRRMLVSSTKASNKTDKSEKKQKTESLSGTKSRQRITFDNKKESEKNKQEETKPKFSNRRVILQRKTTTKEKYPLRNENPDPSQPNPGIFSRAVRTAIADENRIIIKKTDEPQIEYESDSEDEKSNAQPNGLVANVLNLPHGITDTRLKTLAGNDVQSLTLNKEDRSARITFRTASAAESFKKKFNNKMVAASKLAVTIH